MKIISINLGVNGSICYLNGGKVMTHISLSELSHDISPIVSISPSTFSKFFRLSEVTLTEIDYFVFSGYEKSQFKNREFIDFKTVKKIDIHPSNVFGSESMGYGVIDDLRTLYPPYVNRPLTFVYGEFLFDGKIKEAFILPPDLSYASYGYYSTRLTKAVNITISSNDHTVYDGSLITLCDGQKINISERPKLMIGKLYGKMSEMLGFGSFHKNQTTLCDLSTRYHITKDMDKLIDPSLKGNPPLLVDESEIKFFSDTTKVAPNYRVNHNNYTNYFYFNAADINTKSVLKASAYTQRMIENSVIELIERVKDNYSGYYGNNIILSGDLFHNRRLNTKLLNKYEGDINLYINSMPVPQSMALGGAFFIHNMYSDRKKYDRKYCLARTPQLSGVRNEGDDIDFDIVKDTLKNNAIYFGSHFREITKRSMGYQLILFNTDSGYLENNKPKHLSSPFQKPFLIVKEDKFNDYFLPTKYTYSNNTIAKPIETYKFLDFIHDDGYLNVFVINEHTLPHLYDLMCGLDYDYIGGCNFTNTNISLRLGLEFVFDSCHLFGVDTYIIDNKMHVINGKTYGKE